MCLYCGMACFEETERECVCEHIVQYCSNAVSTYIQVRLHDRQYHPSHHGNTAPATNSWTPWQVPSSRQLWGNGTGEHCGNTSWALRRCAGGHSTWYVSLCGAPLPQTPPSSPSPPMLPYPLRYTHNFPPNKVKPPPCFPSDLCMKEIKQIMLCVVLWAICLYPCSSILQELYFSDWSRWVEHWDHQKCTVQGESMLTTVNRETFRGEV